MHRQRSRRLMKMKLVTTNLRTCFAQGIRPVILDASGLALIAVGAFQVGPILGFPVAGIACIALQWRLRG
jgi:hypothetical protein